jgi:mono/diheme cytochrome c family protein
MTPFVSDLRSTVLRFAQASLLACVMPASLMAADVDFARDIQPILAGRCFKCHGPDEGVREAGLRFDRREGALAELDSGVRAVVPGDADNSELLARVTSSDPDVRMPPPSEGDPLTPRQVEALRQWIAAGAGYARHWSYVPPRRPVLPAVVQPQWCRNGIDRLSLSRLERERLAPSVEADRYTLIRRVSLDLTGLPPTNAEVDAFVNDPAPDAYERLVDRLLASPGYGERWARVWLDLARYADSAGYADDPPRVIWQYRDWVIGALNANLPFDQFTIEQLAGDLLPDPTQEQLIATGFHRNTMTNSEGGTDDEEFRNVAVVDRVNTTFAVWMATTIGCAQCHTHKYDPITQEEYYRVFAILNQTEDADRREETPTLSMFTEEQNLKISSLKPEISDAESRFAAAQRAARDAGTLTDPPAGPLLARFVHIELPGTKKILSLAEVQSFVGEENIAVKGKATQSSTDYEGAAARAIDGNTDGHYFNSSSTTHCREEDDPWWELDLGTAATIEKVVIWNRTDAPGIGARLNGARIILLDEQRRALWVQPVAKAPEKDAAYVVPKTGEAFGDADKAALADYQSANSPELRKHRERLDRLKKQLAQVQPVTTPILRELPPDKRRTTRIQVRGNFLDLGAEVRPGVPAAFHALEEVEPDRLALAKWLIDERNPLTARVAANRTWEQLFGIGLVETGEDFGLQGELPSHPELLDWLAVELMQSGWDVKHLVRLIVTSATYRQSSDASPGVLERDPNNRLLSRGPRFRLSAESVRDQALYVSGLLSDKMYGASVKPPRPKLGLTAAFGASTDWDASPGEDRYRRGVYTFWQRSIPYPSMDTFDAPSREVCTVRRIRRNTPLQALVTLNDPVYIEAAQGLARRILAEGEATTHERIACAFRLCVTRPPSAAETAVLTATLERAVESYRGQPEKARAMATDPLGPLPEGADAAEAAAWTVLANVLLNLDETLARR